MNLMDKTKNQHYIPQVEQRLNAINQLAAPKNQRILEFICENHEEYIIQLKNKKGVLISSTLSMNDLFSFDVLDDSTRHNFERLFNKYESEIKIHTDNLLHKINSHPTQDITNEVVSVFAAKFINFIRNPFSIKKILNTFPTLIGLEPTSPIHYNNYLKVISGNKPQKEHICSILNISHSEYDSWLSIIFMLLSTFEDSQPNIIENMVKSIFEKKDICVSIALYTYENKTCLLSDRGYCIPISDEIQTTFDFNLFSHGFIRYMFGDVNKIFHLQGLHAHSELYKSFPKKINLEHIKDDLESLDKYNKNVVHQCHKYVFGSTADCYGVKVNI
ncbi:hypothetical protein ACLHZW_02300 [Aeromonas media]|uniref:hypothetical protein n=1 Tax=Aeromonas media TaxID=651 RepID=UPI003D00A522